LPAKRQDKDGIANKKVEIPVIIEHIFILWFSFTKIENKPPNNKKNNDIKYKFIIYYIPKL